MKRIYLLVLLLPFFLLGCEKTDLENVTTESIKGTVWVEAVYNYGLTNVSVLTFTSINECNILFAGSTVYSQPYQGNYKIENNKIIISIGEAIYECVVKKDELLMYLKYPKTEQGESPSKYRKLN